MKKCVNCKWFLSEKCEKQSAKVDSCDEFECKEYKLDYAKDGIYKFSKLEDDKYVV